MFKKLISICLILSISVLKVSASKEINLSAECAVVINVQTGEVLFSKNPHKKHSMASTTKIMTSLLAVESGRLQSEITITEEMVKVEGTSMGLQVGDSVSLEELVYGMMLPSGNDAANATAVFLGGNLNGFAKMMNERALQIGMKNTNFVTPSGLDSDEHYSTAFDMALLGSVAVKNPKFVSICSSETATLTYGNPPYLRTVSNHNRLLKSYDYVLGIKTGYTKKSGRCLVTYAKKDSAELIVVTLNAPDDWNDHKKLLDYSFGLLNSFEIVPECPERISIVGGVSNYADVTLNPFVYSSIDNKNVSYEVYVNKFIYAPVSKGTVVGKCVYYIDDVVVMIEPVVLNESIERK